MSEKVHVNFLSKDFFLEGIHDPSWEPGIHAVHTAVQNLPMKFLGGVAVKELDHVLPQFLSGSNEANEANNDGENWFISKVTNIIEN
ncbi:cytochrome P450 [Penicillium macrosclerotiorum]|uniref:cytochrome P450 n=1 Tax=Penicillium macrosclerotiorum TaxID=303699 RepID=UPI002548A926|nr:cytochrome P450 [Penicillium macrosclerotiorum]KAJ5675332.1 cytochrome P450 [Penicillium macrosclerotiorum]